MQRVQMTLPNDYHSPKEPKHKKQMKKPNTQIYLIKNMGEEFVY